MNLLPIPVRHAPSAPSDQELYFGAAWSVPLHGRAVIPGTGSEIVPGTGRQAHAVSITLCQLCSLLALYYYFTVQNHITLFRIFPPFLYVSGFILPGFGVFYSRVS